MGLDESKLSHSIRTSNPSLKICTSGPLVPWRIIHQCSPELWKKCHREYFNFPDKPITCSYQLPNECTIAFCLTRQNLMNFRKSAPVFSLKKRKRFSKMAEHFEYNHIPARFSAIHNLHFKSVLASHCGLAVIHLTRNMITEFAVLDLRLNKFLGSFGRQTINFNPESVVGKISPDGNWCLIRLPSTTDRQSSVLKLYHLKGCELLTELFLSPLHTPLRRASRQSVVARSPLAPHQEDNRIPPHDMNNGDYIPVAFSRSTPILFAYDPRFLHSRIAITNVNLKDSPPGELIPSVTLMTLPNWELVATTTDFKCPSVAHRSSPVSGSGSRTVSFGRRRASDAAGHHCADGIQASAPTFTTPHILNLFYSRDGYFLFVVSTEHRVCRCSSINHHSTSALYSPSPSDSPHCNHQPVAAVDSVDANRPTHPTVSFAVPADTPCGSKSSVKPFSTHCTAWAPTMPGCTTIWLTIFNSDTLKRLRTLRFDRPVCPIHTCPTNYIPVMSRCGSRLAILTNHYAPATPPNRSSYPPLNPSRGGIDPQQQLFPSGSVLRHSVPAINVESQQSHPAHWGYSRDLTAKTEANIDKRTVTSSLGPCNRGLAWSSPALPPTPSATSFNSSVRGTSQHSFASYPCNLPTASTPMRQVEVVLVYQLPPPPSLQALIRQKIRQIVQDNMLDRLDLPPRLITYLRFEPTFSCGGSCLSRSSSFSPTLREGSMEFHF